MNVGSSLISKLKILIEDCGSKDCIETLEYVIVEKISEFIKEKSFYELPTNEILNIIGKSAIEDVELLCEIVSRMSESKREESTLLLNVIKREKATLEECTKILSKFEYCQICKRTSELINEDKNLPERDYECEIKELKKEIEKYQNETKKTKVKKKAFFLPVTEKPADFESNICTAAYKGNLTSVRYLVEQHHADVETKDINWRTPINKASLNGRLEIVKYLYETCHVNVETKDIGGFTPINNASLRGLLEIVKYLYETCHADVETKDNDGDTPINNASLRGHVEVVKYLYETCYVNFETKDNYGLTPINNASQNGRLEVVKYLYETCHANVETKDNYGFTPINNASQNGHHEVVKYLRSMSCKY